MTVGIQKYQEVTAIAAKYLGITCDKFSYSEIADDLRLVSGASYAVLNIYYENRGVTRTVAISGISANISRASEIFGFNLVGKEWEIDDLFSRTLQEKKLVNFGEIKNVSPRHIVSRIGKMLGRLFNIGDTYAIAIICNERIIGTLVLVMKQGDAAPDPVVIELFAQFTGALLLRIETEKKLAEQSNQFRVLAETSPDMMTVVNRDGRILFINKTFEKPGAENAVGNNILDYVPANYRDIYRSWMNKTFDFGKKVLGEIDIDARHFSVRMIPLNEMDGEPVIMIITEDITERAKINDKLLRQELLLSELSSLEQVGGWELDLTTMKTLSVGATRAIFGISIPPGEELDMESALMYVQRKDRDMLKASVQDCIATGEKFNHQILVRVHGKDKWVKITGNVQSRSGKPYRMVGSVLDITEQKRKEARLVEITSRLNEMLDNLDDVTWSLDPQLNLLFINKSCEAVFGYAREAFMNNRSLWMSLFDPEEFDVMLTALKGQKDNDYVEGAIRIRSGDGIEKFVYNKLKIIRDPQNRTIRIDGYSRDISQKRRDEESFMKTVALLEVVNTNNLDFISSPSGPNVMTDMLHRVLRLTESEFGFMGQIEEHNGQTILRKNAIAHQSTDKNVARFFDKAEGEHWELKELTNLLAYTVRTGKSIISNDLLPEQTGKTLPADHPQVHSCLSIPVFWKSKLVGMIALANKPGGYSEELLLFLEPFVSSYSAIIRAREMESQRQLAEKKFEQSFLQLHEFIDEASDLVQSLDGEGRVIYVNQAWCNTLGYTKEEASRLTIEDIVHPGYLQHCSELIKRSRHKGKPVKTETVFITRDGKDVLVEGSVSVTLGADSSSETKGIFRNITESKNKELQISLSEERYRKLFENSQGLMCIHDTMGRFLSVNQAGARALGYEVNELIGKFLHDIIPAEYSRETEKYLDDIIENGYASGIMKVIHRNGEEHVWMYKNVLVIATTGEKTIIGNAIDVTERVVMETELKEAKEAAERNAMAKERFLTNMSHEIRTPMNAILGYSELLKDLTYEEKPKSYINGIVSAGKNLLGLINDILDLSKITSGRIDLEISPVDITKTLTDLQTVFFPRMEEKNLSFEIHISPAVPQYVALDEIKIRQVLFNLLGNAFKFTQKGGITVSLYTTPVNNKNEKVNLVFEVTDTGIGIHQDQLELIFEPFRQQEKQSTKKYEGTGLGLSISRRLVEMMDGRLSVVSNPGSGSTFTVELDNKDVVQMEQLKPADETAEMVYEFDENLILLAEDVTSNREIIKGFLEPHGLKVVEAVNGEEAIALAEKERPALILMDMMMPVMDGYEATVRIKNNPDLAGIPIIALTAVAFRENEYAIRDVCDDYIRKPVVRKEFLGIISKYLGHRKKQSDANGNAALGETAETEEAVLFSGKQLLIVEDSPLNQSILKAVLEDKWGAETDEVFDSSEAASRLGEKEYDAIIIDYHLGVLNGAELTKLIRQESGGQVPVIIISGEPKETIEQECFDAGANAVLRKPVQFDLLKKSLSQLVFRKTAATSKQEMEAAPFSLSNVKELAAGDPVRLKQWILEYRETLLLAMKTLQGFMDSGRIKKGNSEIHNLMGLAFYFGGHELMELLRHLNLLIHEATRQENKPVKLTGEMEEVIERTLDIIHKTLAAFDTSDDELLPDALVYVNAGKGMR